jgi:beta-lactamase regulating signal transducer with metallopeptidase domain
MRSVLGCLPVETAAKGDPFWTAARRAGVQPEWIRVVPGLPNPAFTAGWLRPRIYIASELAERLDPDELTTVLAHEGAHALRRDPLRLSALRFLADTLFWIPALRRIADDIADETEVLADDQASRDHPLALASAILALARWIRPSSAARLKDVVGFAQRADLLDRRIRRLAGEAPEAQSHLTRRSIAGAVGALGLVWISGAMMVHPLPAADSPHHLNHCSHPNAWAITHLFCGGSGPHPSPDHCPHAGR